MASFSSFDDATQAVVREVQRQRKQEKLRAKKQKQQQKPPPPPPPGAAEDYPTLITQDAYFDACPGGRFRDPTLPPCDESLALLLRALDAGDDQARSLSACHYFQVLPCTPHCL